MKISTYKEIVKAVIFSAILFLIFYGAYQAVGFMNDIKYIHTQREEIELEKSRQELQIAINQARAETQIYNKDQWEAVEKMLENEHAAIMEVINQSKEEVKNVGEINMTANENLSLNLHEGADHAYKEGSGEEEEQYFKKIMMTEKNEEGEEISIPIAWVMAYPNKVPFDFKTGVYPWELHVDVIQAEQKDGQWNSYIEAWMINPKDNDSAGIELPVNVRAQFKQKKKTGKEFFWWAPHLSLNLDVSKYTGGGIAFSLSGYGRTKNDLSWRFFDFGVSTDSNDYWMKFSPAAYNLGEHIPFVSNTFLSPFVGYSGNKEFIGGVSLSIPF